MRHFGKELHDQRHLPTFQGLLSTISLASVNFKPPDAGCGDKPRAECLLVRLPVAQWPCFQ